MQKRKSPFLGFMARLAEILVSQWGEFAEICRYFVFWRVILESLPFCLRLHVRRSSLIINK